MRTTVQVDERVLKEAMELTRAKTKREVIQLSLKELVRNRRLKRLRERLGHTELDIDLEGLEEMRGQD